MNIVNPVISRYTDGFYRPLNDELGKLRAQGRKPEKVLEIGCAIGYSASFFASACDCSVTTVEADEGMFNTAKANIAGLGLSDRIRVIHGDGIKVLEELSPDEDGLYDMVFIDAAKSHYRSFWDRALPLCSDGALIICDNILMKGMTASDEFDTRGRYKTSMRRMREFLEYIGSIPYGETYVLPVGDGISLSIIDKEKI